MRQALLNKPMRDYTQRDWAIARREAKRLQAALANRTATAH